MISSIWVVQAVYVLIASSPLWSRQICQCAHEKMLSSLLLTVGNSYRPWRLLGALRAPFLGSSNNLDVVALLAPGCYEEGLGLVLGK